MKTILVGYDESEPARRALDRAAELAVAFDADVIVTSVAPACSSGRRPRAGSARSTRPTRRSYIAKSSEHAATAFLGKRGVRAEYSLALGDPAREILDLAENRNVDLIVVGARELSLLERLLGLSVSGAVKRRAHCDVLVVR